MNLNPLRWFRASPVAGISPLTDPSPEVLRAFGVSHNRSGVVVNEATAMSASAVFACVRNLAEDIAKLPLVTYRQLKPRGKERATDHYLYRLLHDEPNDEMTAFDFRQAMMVGAALYGKGVAEIQRRGDGRPVALWPIEPWRVQAKRTTDGTLYYLVDGTHRLAASDVLFIHGLSVNGIVGYMVTSVGGESIGVTLAAQQFAATFYGNGSRPGGVIKYPKALTPQAAKRLKEAWDESHKGVDNAQKTVVLEEGAEFIKQSVDPEEAQFLETRQFQVEEVARWFRMPPHKIQQLLRATFSNIEHQSIEYVTDTLMPWLVRIEQEFRRKLVSRSEPTIFCEHIVAALLRGDIKSRYDAYAIGRQWGWLSADDICEMENMNPLPDGRGQTYLTPLNMGPALPMQQTITAAELDFKRKAWLGFQADGTVADVVANLSGIKQLTKDVGLPVNEEYEEPYLPIVADTGPLVSGAIISDPDGAIVGGDVENDLPAEDGGRNGSPTAKPVDETGDPVEGEQDGAEQTPK